MKKDVDRRCQCDACRRDGSHWSDCAVHNAPAYPVGKCNCGKTLNRRDEMRSEHNNA
jgi:hypothetical protein